MAYVAGNSSTVRALESLLKQTLSAIDSHVGSLESAMSTIRSGFNDSGVDEIEDAIKSIKSAVESSKDGAGNVEQALDAYASYLESIGK